MKREINSLEKEQFFCLCRIDRLLCCPVKLHEHPFPCFQEDFLRSSFKFVGILALIFLGFSPVWAQQDAVKSPPSATKNSPAVKTPVPLPAESATQPATALPPSEGPAQPATTPPPSPHATQNAVAPAAQGNGSQITLNTSETLFSVMAALNSCGYDEELSQSEPIRAQIRGEVAKIIAATEEAANAGERLCRFYKDHEQADSGRNLAQYISLGLYMDQPPAFSTSIRESDLPPDAGYVLGFIPLLQTFYQAAGLHDIWLRHRREYESMVARFHEPVAKMILQNDLYLKLQLSSYLGRRFELTIEPMGAPGEINARNYGDDYFLVLSPSQGKLRLREIRHTYLHYVLDPYAQKRGTSLKRLEPLQLSLSTAPMDESFKDDIGLLVTECLIRAIEARTLDVSGKNSEQERRQAVQNSVNEGFTLTQYFYNALAQFEKDPAGLKDTYGDWLYNIDVAREKKFADNVTFSTQAAPEALNASKPKPSSLLDFAEQRLDSHDLPEAQKLAQQALDQQSEDPARALFILARTATQNGDMSGARAYFERTLEVAHEPRTLAWSHIYLGRIFDLQENREAALKQYSAAMAAGDTAPATKTAAERGLAAPYEPPVQRQKK